MNREIFVVCKNFGSASPMFYHPAYGWGKDKVEMFDSEMDAWLECQAELSADDVSIERFVTNKQATVH